MFCAMLSYALTLWLLFEKEVRPRVPVAASPRACADLRVY